MASFNDTFKRIEKKYRLSAKQYNALMPYLVQHMCADEYGRSTITSLYLDTDNHDLICRSLEKPLYKEKLRVRYYGTIDTLNNESEVFLEIKKKYKGIVYKRRLCISWAAAKAFLSGMNYCKACTTYPLKRAEANYESLSTKSRQIAREIRALINRFGELSFSMAISCERTAYARCQNNSFDCNQLSPTDQSNHTAVHGNQTTAVHGKHAAPSSMQPESPLEIDDDLRITFDENIRYSNCEEGGVGQADGGQTNASQTDTSQTGAEQVGLGQTDASQTQLLNPTERLMEIKAVGSFPLWLAQALSECEIKPSSFSKYGEAFKAVSASC